MHELRSKHQTESLAGKHQYFPRTARATNTHSIRLQMANDANATVTLAFERERDVASGEKESRRARGKCPKSLALGSSYTRWRVAVVHIYARTAPCRHSRAARRGTHASRSYETRYEEAKRRERYALPIYSCPPTPTRILRIFNYDLPVPRTKSLHALSRRGKSIDTYARVIAHATRHCAPIASHARLCGTAARVKARISVNHVLLLKNRSHL